MKYYTCEYCYKEFEPKRRRVQKYCSNTCRSKAYHARKTKHEKKSGIVPVKDSTPENNELAITSSKTKIESVSLGGIVNATIGTLTAKRIDSVFTAEENKLATKGDLIAYTNTILGRYHLVKNIQRRQSDGALPYYDMETNKVVYSIWTL
jgi:hypothetical protein